MGFSSIQNMLYQLKFKTAIGANMVFSFAGDQSANCRSSSPHEQKGSVLPSVVNEEVSTGCRVVLRRDIFVESFCSTLTSGERSLFQSSDDFVQTSQHDIVTSAPSLIPEEVDRGSRKNHTKSGRKHRRSSKYLKRKIHGERECSSKSALNRKANGSGGQIQTGRFVVLKTDFISCTYPPLWRVDGKNLLQKFVHFDEAGEIHYKSTSTYSGWSVKNKRLFYPAPVDFISKQSTGKDLIVKFLRNAVEVSEDSD